MSSIPGLPTQGSDVTIHITRVHLHPLSVLVEFWGKFSQSREVEYECLAKDLQSLGKTIQEFEGSPGDLCLIQINCTWYRARIISKNASKYSVFLIDKGITSCTTTSNLAWGKKEIFLLPPEVEFCVLANVLPVPTESRWSPVALEYLRSLSGKSEKAHVQNVLVPHRTFILHIPSIAKQMYEMGFAKKLSPDMFQDYVLMSLKPETQQISFGAGERLQKQEHFMVPELSAGTVETVIVTEVTGPQRIFCQLRVFSQELKKLSEKITQCCEGRVTSCPVGPEMIGFPCAARGTDGRWYRSVLQQVFPAKGFVEVLNVDYGTKQIVQVDNVRPLAKEFFRMPVVTYICSLHGVIDKGVGWTASQIDFLRNLLLNKTVIAKFEYQSMSEGVHYATLYGDENTNINKLFASKESCLLECEKTLGDYAIRSPAYSLEHQAQQEKNQRKMLNSGKTGEEKGGKGVAEKLPAEYLSLNSSHVAFVKHVSNPSEFWIQTHNYAKELDKLMDSIYHLYKGSENKDVVTNPTVGLYCAAKAKDGDFYRATVSEVGETQIKVFFIDYGNTEDVERINIRTLPDKWKNLPRLALKCTLAGVRPKDERWSQSASEFFIKAVTDKILNAHVTGKYDDGYIVQLTDPDAQEERDLSTLMCSSNLAERADAQKQPQANVTIQPAILPPAHHQHAGPSGVYWNKGTSFQTQNTIVPDINKGRIPLFKEQMFPIGSNFDVSVSYIESPNDFWCQLVQNTGDLKLLMHEIQAHYSGSEYQPLLEAACVARHPHNKMWYRALVIHKHETPHVDVLFVDYGQTETISLCDLRRICPEFLTLPGQAFRCSLLNLVDPTSAINEWNDKAIARFHNFVEVAASNFVILKCTLYAVMYSEQKIVFNIVDLETPFESVCTSMVNLVKSVPPKKVSGQSFRLDTYYYSTHNVKIGTEEQITVTCVNNVNQFYCQLERNADVIEDLNIKVSNICRQLENVKLPGVFGTLCFAKYTDGHWYRGQIKATKPAIWVHFVDYGDTIEVDKPDLFPVPKEAYDIMSVPVQAVVCSLSDVPTNVPSDVNTWFETCATESKFRALVVAREPDGTLLVELYHGNTQINSKIKKMFRIEMHKEESVVTQCHKALDVSAKHTENPRKDVPKQSGFSAPKPAPQMRDETKPANTNLQYALKPSSRDCENGQKVKAVPIQLYKPPHQRQSCTPTSSNTGNGSEPSGAMVKQRNEKLPTDINQLSKSKSPGTDSQKEIHVEKLPKLADLPSKSITSGTEADVYVSHLNSPLDFYVQLVMEEDELFSIVEKLNDPTSIRKTEVIKDVHPGDLVQAEFQDDSSWYRAVVREMHSNSMALVEFVDFGNTAMTQISKMGKLHESFLLQPGYSTHCMLSDVASRGKEEMLDPNVQSAFKEAVCGEGDKKLNCRFIRQSGSVWEVSLDDSGVNVICKVPIKCSTDGSEITPEKLKEAEEKPAQNSEEPPLNSCSLHYRQQEFLEEQKLQIYITTINDGHSFWGQCADSEELDKIASGVSEVGNAADHKNIDLSALSSGSPCIVLFSDDLLWYRAEVTDKDGDELSVLFVDYGNQCQVNITDVREIPPDLVETPRQAFLFELEGFDSSCGFWESGTVDELFALIADKLLQLTVTRVTRDEEIIKYSVQMECDGQVINEVMKTWWKSTENQTDAGELTTSYKPPQQCDSNVREAAQPEDQVKYPQNNEMDTAVACIPLQRDHGEQFTDELVEPHGADEAKLASSPKTSETPEYSIDLDSFAESPKEEIDQKSPEFNMDVGHEERASIEGANIAPTVVIFQTESKDILPCDSGIEETMLSPFADEDLSILSCDADACETDKGSEEDASVTDTVWPGDLNDPSDENLMETDKSEIQLIDLESSAEEVNTCTMGSIYDTMIYFDPTNDRSDSKIDVARDSSLTSVTAVKMVPHEALGPSERVYLHEAFDMIAEELDKIQTELLLPSTLLPGQQLCDAPTEQEVEAGSGVPQVPCVSTHAKNDLMTEDEIAAPPEDTSSALLFHNDHATSEPRTCTVPFSDKMEDVGPDVKHDLHTTIAKDSNEILNESLGAPSEQQSLQDEVKANEDVSRSEDETSALHEDELSALPCGIQPRGRCPDLGDLVEELTSLVGEICLTDPWKDQCQQAETDDGEQMVNPPPKQEEDSDESTLSQETASSADESFEFQLSTVTHLYLVVRDGAADALPVEQQSEE
ncbi:tudor domain-containing 6 isoform X2 [Scophthalmus maximus]|uniref:tudor domain-containing 6 isoform X2 n=1 Tax=Scophthalmus maximus TaxID=52904 RepID=UPI001FA85E35|nr:tudor domain-containing 6 isoform X2 [Scophthalmus maximus]